jgi:hypothetical protein
MKGSSRGELLNSCRHSLIGACWAEECLYWHGGRSRAQMTMAGRMYVFGASSHLIS